MLYNIIQKILSFIPFFKKDDYFKNAIEKDILKMEDLIIFFKSENVMEKLKSNANILAVSLKSKNKDYYQLVCTLYDNEKKEIIDSENYTLVFKSKKLDDNLINAFDDKDMIILK